MSSTYFFVTFPSPVIAPSGHIRFPFHCLELWWPIVVRDGSVGFHCWIHIMAKWTYWLIPTDFATCWCKFSFSNFNPLSHYYSPWEGCRMPFDMFWHCTRVLIDLILQFSLSRKSIRLVQYLLISSIILFKFCFCEWHILSNIFHFLYCIFNSTSFISARSW
jgi:hypothetical protein